MFAFSGLSDRLASLSNRVSKFQVAGSFSEPPIFTWNIGRILWLVLKA